jgi:type I restriction enzyme S subunit
VQTGSIGEVGIVPKELEGANCHALIILRAYKKLGLGDYLMWILSSSFGFYSLLSIKTGDILHHLNSTRVRDLKIPVPPIDEQAKIVDFIYKKESINRKAVEYVENQIKLLKEYRTTLISEVVTGKIDVRDEVIP